MLNKPIRPERPQPKFEMINKFSEEAIMFVFAVSLCIFMMWFAFKHDDRSQHVVKVIQVEKTTLFLHDNGLVTWKENDENN